MDRGGRQAQNPTNNSTGCFEDKLIKQIMVSVFSLVVREFLASAKRSTLNLETEKLKNFLPAAEKKYMTAKSKTLNPATLSLTVQWSLACTDKGPAVFFFQRFIKPTGEFGHKMQACICVI
jgi:hypothetical protein